MVFTAIFSDHASMKDSKSVKYTSDEHHQQL